jgi:predicted acetyltransferase
MNEKPMKITTTDESNYHKRELFLDDGTGVSRLIINDLLMRIGSTPVTMAGIGDVYTQWRYRSKGYMRQLYEDTLTYMANQGYCVSVLFGIDNFYNKWGYATCLPDYTGKIKVRDAENTKSTALGLRMRPVEKSDMEAILHLYNAYNSSRTGSIVRYPETFTKFSRWADWDSGPTPVMWEDEHSNLIAYAVTDKDNETVRLTEVATLRNDLFPDILYNLAMQGVEKRCESITLKLPIDHPFAEYAQRYGTKWKTNYARNGDGMMRIINQRQLITILASELERRIARSPLRAFTGILTLKTDLDATRLHIRNGHITVNNDDNSTLALMCQQDQLMQLLVGYRSVKDVLIDNTVQTKGDVIPILEVLFPKGVPFMYAPDYF